MSSLRRRDWRRARPSPYLESLPPICTLASRARTLCAAGSHPQTGDLDGGSSEERPPQRRNRPAAAAQTAGSEAASGQVASPPAAPRITFRLSSAHLRRVGEMAIPS